VTDDGVAGAGAAGGVGVDPTTQLADRVRGLRTRAGTGELDRALLIVGGVLLPLGVLVVFLGWLGTSHTVLLFEQIPYLVSGGMLGLALVVVGGFVYFTYWQTILVRESRAHNRALLATLDRIEGLLGQTGALPASPAAPARPGRPARSAPLVASADGQLVATATGTMLHRRDCSVVAGRENLRLVAVGTPGFEPCRICQPLAD
jgi:hypothetical protein